MGLFRAAKILAESIGTPSDLFNSILICASADGAVVYVGQEIE